MTNGNGHPPDHPADHPPEHVVPPNTPPNLAPHVWQKGQSGNPGGKRKGESLTALFDRILDECPIDAGTNKPGAGMTNRELLARSIVKAAISGQAGTRASALAHLLARIAPLPKGEDGHDAMGMPVNILIFEERAEFVESRVAGDNGHGNGRGEAAGELEGPVEDGGGDDAAVE